MFKTCFFEACQDLLVFELKALNRLRRPTLEQSLNQPQRFCIAVGSQTEASTLGRDVLSASMTASCTSDPSCLSPEPCSGTTVADLVAAALVPPCLDEDEIFSAVAPASQPVRVCPASRMQDDEFRSFPWTQTPEPRVLPSFARTPDKVADLERNSASQSTGARTNDGVAGSKTPSTKSRRAVCPQLALSDALLRPRTAQLPTASVLDSSVVRQKRLCRRGPDGTAQRFEKEKSHLHAQAGTEMPEDPDSQTGLAQQALVTTRPGTCTPLRVPAHPAPHRRRKKLEVESAPPPGLMSSFCALLRRRQLFEVLIDYEGPQCQNKAHMADCTEDYTQATESWMARPARGCMYLLSRSAAQCGLRDVGGES